MYHKDPMNLLPVITDSAWHIIDKSKNKNISKSNIVTTFIPANYLEVNQKLYRIFIALVKIFPKAWEYLSRFIKYFQTSGNICRGGIINISKPQYFFF